MPAPVLQTGYHSVGTKEVEVYILEARKSSIAGLNPIADLPGGHPRQHTDQQDGGRLPEQVRGPGEVSWPLR